MKVSCSAKVLIQDCLVCLVCFLVVILSRSAAIKYSAELNPDESQMLVQAIRLKIDWVPWRGMDGTTGGPLNSAFLALLHLFGMPLEYQNIHFLAAVLMALNPIMIYLALRHWNEGPYTRFYGALGALALSLYTAKLQSADFIHFTSELLPAFVCGLAVCITLSCLSGRVRQGIGLATAGLLLGSLPWIKMQATPVAVAIGAWIVLYYGFYASPADRALSKALNLLCQ